MPSSYTTSARFTLQATGENNNTWGVILNSGVFQLVDDNVNGRLAFALSGAKALTSNLGATDEARMAFLDVTGGTGGAITIPSVTKGYFVRNGSAGNVSVSAGGTAATFQPGDAGPTFSDGSNVYPVLVGGKTIRNYIDSAYPAGPPVAGQAGKFFGNDGVNLGWYTATPLRWTLGGLTSTDSVILNATGVSPDLIANRANGTLVAPSAVLAGNVLLTIQGRGYGATGFSGARSQIYMTAAQNWTDTAQGSGIAFVTTANNTIVPVVRWSIEADGSFRPGAPNAYDIGWTGGPVRNIYTSAVTSSGPLVVNLGPTPPPAPIDASVGLQITGPTGLGPRIELNGFGLGPQYNGRHANGTAAAPTASTLGSALLVVGARGYGTTGYATSNRSSITFSASENWTDTAQGAQIDFSTTPLGAAASTARWSIANDGHFLPLASNTYNIGSGALPVRNFDAAGLITVNRQATAAPVPQSAGTVFMGVGATNAQAELVSFGDQARYMGRRANGTNAAPTPLVAADLISSFSCFGRETSGWAVNRGAGIDFVAASNWTDASHGTQIRFFTTSSGLTAGDFRWVIGADGNFSPFVGGAYDVGTAGAPVRDIYAAGVVSINRSGATAPAPIDAATAIQAVNSPGFAAQAEMTAYANVGRFAGRRANGTPGAPTGLLAAETITSLAAYGYGASSFTTTPRAQVILSASENWTNAAQGTQIRFQTTPNGSVGPLVRWDITNDGHFLPVTASASDVGSAALPVRDIYASTVTERYKVGGIVAPTFLSDIPSNSQVNIGAGGSLRANTNAQAAVLPGHHIVVLNFSGAAITITQEPSAVLYWCNPAGVVQTGNRTIANSAYVTIVSIGTSWAISGTGIT